MNKRVVEIGQDQLIDRGVMVLPGYGEEFEELLSVDTQHDRPLDFFEKIRRGRSSRQRGGGLIFSPASDYETKLLHMFERLWFKTAQVQHNDRAIELLAKLYENTVLTTSDLGRNVGPRSALALAMLAAADLCDVDPHAARIGERGKALVEELRSAGREEIP